MDNSNKSGAGSAFAVLFQGGIVLIGVFLIWYGATLSTDSAVHQIYQLNAITSGLVLIAIVGVWGAVDALRQSFERLPVAVAMPKAAASAAPKEDADAEYPDVF